jgi:hypothetical protein
MGYAHRFRPTYPDFLHGSPPTSACAAFLEESRMSFTNASKFARKSGVRCSERAPSDFLSRYNVKRNRRSLHYAALRSR